MFDSKAVEERIGYTFQDKSILKKAFTHKSYVNLHGGESNDRMEYLGDAILQMLVSEEQYFSDEAQGAGDMTKRRQKLVSKKPLRKAVEKMQVTEYLLFEGGEANIGEKTVSDLYECLIAAIYFDGGYEAAKSFWKRHPLLEEEVENYKGELQELLKAEPSYSYYQTGPDHKPVFHASVAANGETGEGVGGSKRAAEQAAAKSLLDKLKKVEKKKV